MSQDPPASVFHAEIKNYLKTPLGPVKKIVKWTSTKSSSFSHNIGASIGIEATVKAGIPLIAEASVTTSASMSYAYTNTKETSESKTESMEVPCTVPP